MCDMIEKELPLQAAAIFQEHAIANLVSESGEIRKTDRSL